MEDQNNFNYSIIIPHKNIPELLQRCLESIPVRDDVQVIVVDDNSDPDKVDFSTFPGLNRPYTEVYFTKEGKGAGYARNIGLSKAKGKWLVFADADDFFNDCLNQKMNEYLNSTADIVYFQSNSVESDTMNKIESRAQKYNDWLQESQKKNIVLDEVRYKINPPWSKFYSINLVREHDIKFDEVLVANDVMFSTKCGYAAKEILVDLSYLYCSTIRRGSLDLTNIDTYVYTRFDIALTHFIFLKKIKKEKYRMNIFYSINMIRKLNNWKALKYSFINAYREMGLINIAFDFFEVLKQKFYTTTINLRGVLIFILATSLYSCGLFDFPEEKIINISDNTNWKIIWEDNFDGDSIDYSSWSKTPRTKALWAKHMTNNDTCYEVRDGVLILRGVVNNFIKNDPSPYLTGGIETIKKKNITYGKVEVRAKMNKVDTAWPAIWMKTEDRTWLGEIDIMETFDNYDKKNLISQTVHSHYIINLGLKNKPKHTGVNVVNDKSEYNIYGVIINEKEVLFYVNNKITFKYPKIITEEEGQYPYGDPKFLILSMQLGYLMMEGKAPNITELQPEMHVDWVRFYEKIDKTLPDY